MVAGGGDNVKDGVGVLSGFELGSDNNHVTTTTTDIDDYVNDDGHGGWQRRRLGRWRRRQQSWPYLPVAAPCFGTCNVEDIRAARARIIAITTITLLDNGGAGGDVGGGDHGDVGGGYDGDRYGDREIRFLLYLCNMLLI